VDQAEQRRHQSPAVAPTSAANTVANGSQGSAYPPAVCGTGSTPRAPNAPPAHQHSSLPFEHSDRPLLESQVFADPVRGGRLGLLPCVGPLGHGYLKQTRMEEIVWYWTMRHRIAVTPGRSKGRDGVAIQPVGHDVVDEEAVREPICHSCLVAPGLRRPLNDGFDRPVRKAHDSGGRHVRINLVLGRPSHAYGQYHDLPDVVGHPDRAICSSPGRA